MSALGARPGARSVYHRTKWTAEEAVRDSALDWTIFRPSIIFGPGDEFISMLAGLIRWSPVVPVLGDGQYRLQPIPVEQVADGFAEAIRRPATVRQVYEVGGPEPYRFVDILEQIAAALGRRRPRTIHVPLRAVKLMTRALGWLPFYPVTPDQIAMLEEESVTDPRRFFADFGIEPEPLARGLARMFAAS
jgi:NADH dehydrogenase